MKKVIFTTALLVGLLAFVLPAQATVIFELDYEYSGGVSPRGTAPWLTATFEDVGSGTGTVELTMEAVGLTGDEFVTAWYFNLDPYFDPSDLVFERLSGQWPRGIEEGAGLAVGDDFANVAGGGLFDIGFFFTTSEKPAGEDYDRFKAREDSVWQITFKGDRVDLFDEESFSFPSTPSGDNGTYLTAAHVQGIALEDGRADGSGWIAPSDSVCVPEPSTMLLLGVGLIGLAGIGRKKFVKKQ